MDYSQPDTSNVQAELRKYALSGDVANFNHLRQQFPSITPDLHRLNLADKDLDGINLRNADLRFTRLADTSLRHADLHSANLFSTNLQGVDFSGANLTGAFIHPIYYGPNSWKGAIIDETTWIIDSMKSAYHQQNP